jgi:hypothetical protein
VLGAQLARQRDLFGNRLAIDILVLVVMHLEPEQPVLPDLHDALRTGIKPDHQWPRQLLDRRREGDPGHQRHIAGLHAPVCEIDRCRCLRGARDPDQHHVGVFQVFDMLSVVMQHGVVQRIDTLEIFRIERVLGTHPMAGLSAEIGLQQGKHRSEDRQAGNAELAAVVLEPFRQVFLHQRIEHDAGSFLDLRQHAVELLLCPHQWIGMLHRQHLGVLRRRRARDRRQRLAGGVRDEMQVKVATGSIGHRPGTACERRGDFGEKAMPWRPTQAPRPTAPDPLSTLLPW